MAMQDPAGGGRLVVIDASVLASDAVAYTVADGKTFVGFVQAGGAASVQYYKVNGVTQVLPIIVTNGAAFAPVAVTWPAGTVVSKNAAHNFFIQGNEL